MGVWAGGRRGCAGPTATGHRRQRRHGSCARAGLLACRVALQTHAWHRHPLRPSTTAPRFWEDQIRDKEVLLEKVSLKNSTYKAAIAKLEAQLAHKEEMGEVRSRGEGAA